MDRVIVEDNRRVPPVVPRATPGFSTVTPQYARQTNDRSLAEGLATALSGFSGPIATLAASYREQQFEDAQVEAQDTLGGMTLEEARAAVASGEMAQSENPYFQAAFEKQYGMAYAAQRKRDIATWYDTQFDRDTGDLEQGLIGFVQEDGELYGANEQVSAGIREGMAGFLDGVRDQHAQYRAGRMQQEVGDRFYAVARDAVQRSIATGGDASAAVRALYDDHKGTLGMSFGQMDDAVLQIADELAHEGQLEVVQRLLSATSQGADGTPVQSFLDKRTTGPKAQAILRRAEATAADNRAKKNFRERAEFAERAAAGAMTDVDEAILEEKVLNDEISPAYASGLLATNGRAQRKLVVEAGVRNAEALFIAGVAERVALGQWFTAEDQTYVDEDGTSHSFKAEDTIQAITDSSVKQMQDAGKSDAEIAATLTRLGLPGNVRVWEDTLSNGHIAIHQAFDAAGDDQVDLPPAASEAYDLWKSLGDHESYRRRHIKDADAQNIFRDAEMLESVGGMDPALALSTSSKINRDGGRTSLSARIDMNALQSSVSDAVSGGIFGSDAGNAGYVSSQIEQLAFIYIGAGLSMNKAVEAAEENFGQTHTIIRGVAINTANNLVPDNFEDVIEAPLAAYAATNDLDPDDLAMSPYGRTGRFWQVIDKNTLMPVGLGSSDSIFDTRNLEATFREAQEADRKGAMIEANAAIERIGIINERTEVLRRMNRRHRRHHLRHLPGSPEYLELQRKHGKKLYPDGGLIDQDERERLFPSSGQGGSVAPGAETLSAVGGGLRSVYDALVLGKPLPFEEGFNEWLREISPTKSRDRGTPEVDAARMIFDAMVHNKPLPAERKFQKWLQDASKKLQDR